MKCYMKTVLLSLLVCAFMLAVTSCDLFGASDSAESTDTLETVDVSDTDATTEAVTNEETSAEKQTEAETANNRPIELPVVP